MEFASIEQAEQPKKNIISPRTYKLYIAYLFLSYTRPQDVIWALNQFHLTQILMIVLLLDLVILHFKSFRLIKTKFDLLFPAFIFALIIGLFTSIWRGQSVEVITEILKIYASYLLLINVIDNYDRLLGVIKTIVLGSFIVSIVQIFVFIKFGLNRLTGLGGYGLNFPMIASAGGDAEGVGGYVNGFLGNSSDLGVGVLIAMPLAVLLMRNTKNKFMRIFYAGAFICFFISIICSGSRGAFLGLAAILLYAWVKSDKKIKYMAIAIIGIALTLALAPEKYFNRLKSIQTYEEDESANIRMDLWSAGLKMFKDRPIQGMGAGNFSTAYGTKYHPDKKGGVLWWNPHNIFVHVLSEAGVLGLAPYLLLIICSFYLNIKNEKCLKFHSPADSPIGKYIIIAIKTSLLGFLISGQFITVTYYPHLFLLAGFTSAASGIVKSRLKNKTSQLGDPVDA
jgi:probable O-glycosylation ligase (exosortase A-associated)